MLYRNAIAVDYGQILIYRSDLPRPGLIWTHEHGAQGFAYAPGIVSFGVPDLDGECLLRVDQVHTIRVKNDTIWAICVPFEVLSTSLKIGTALCPIELRLNSGKYNLVFEAVTDKNRKYSLILDISFCLCDNPEFSILKHGYGITTDGVLRKDAEFA